MAGAKAPAIFRLRLPAYPCSPAWLDLTMPYGDMAAGYNPLQDQYKTRVFKTRRWRNANHRSWVKGAIRPRVIEKPPLAELREDQHGNNSQPPATNPARASSAWRMTGPRRRRMWPVGMTGGGEKSSVCCIYLNTRDFSRLLKCGRSCTASVPDRRYPIINQLARSGLKAMSGHEKRRVRARIFLPCTARLPNVLGR